MRLHFFATTTVVLFTHETHGGQNVSNEEFPTHPVTAKPRWKKLLSRLLVFLVAILALTASAIFVVVRYYEDDVVKYALGRINEKLITKAGVKEVDLSFWATFPHASLQFSELYIEDTTPEKDTLVYAKNLYLEFSLLDLFRGNYTIKEIEAETALANLKVDKKGHDNWHIWKSNPADSSKFNLNLKRIDGSQLHVLYEDQSSRFFTDATINTVRAKGAFEDAVFDLKLTSDLTVHSLYSGKSEYASDRNLALDLQLNADNNKGIYQIQSCDAKVEAIPLTLSGVVSTGDKGTIDLTVSGNDISVSDLLASLPQSMRESADSYSPNGTLSLNGSIKGPYTGKSSPKVMFNFNLQEGEIKQSSSGVALNHINLDGSYSNASGEDFLQLKQLSAQLETGSLQASGTLRNLDAPVADFNLNTQAQLSDLKSFFGWDTLEVCEGSIVANASIKGALSALGNGSFDWSAVQTTGHAELQNARFKLVNSSRNFENIQGIVNLSNQNATIQHFGGTVNGSDFQLTGNVFNLMPFFTNDNQKLVVDATLRSQQIDFTNLVENTSSTSATDEYKLQLPGWIDFTLNSSINQFKFRQFAATNVRGVIRLTEAQLSADPVAFQTADGEFQAQLNLIKTGESNYKLLSRATLNRINIQKLFAEFENFGQTFITEQNLRGVASATVQYEAPMSAALRIDTDNMVSLVDISIDNGQLINLESLQEVAAYMRNNRWVAPFVNADKFSERLKDIKFSRLENVIEIKNKTITIPQMDIKSSALDISAQGKHFFDNRIDYTIGFKLRDILIQRETDEVRDDGGKMIYLFMRGTTEKPEFGLDKEASKSSRAEELAAEKANVKALLKQELGLFKNDASVGAYKEESQTKQTTTTIQWDEFDGNAQPTPQTETKQEFRATSPKPKETPATTPANGKKVPRWLQEKGDVSAQP